MLKESLGDTQQSHWKENMSDFALNKFYKASAWDWFFTVNGK